MQYERGAVGKVRESRVKEEKEGYYLLRQGRALLASHSLPHL